MTSCLSFWKSYTHAIPLLFFFFLKLSIAQVLYCKYSLTKDQTLYVSLRSSRISQLPPLPFFPFLMWSSHANLPPVPTSTLCSPTSGPLHPRSSWLEFPCSHQASSVWSTPLQPPNIRLNVTSSEKPFQLPSRLLAMLRVAFTAPSQWQLRNYWIIMRLWALWGYYQLCSLMCF